MHESTRHTPPANNRSSPQLGLPLADIRVVDFSWAVAGPATTKILALFGADVIKIESRARIDGGRLGTPFLNGRPGINKSGYFSNHNTSKRSIRLDLSKPESKKIVKRLVSVADVVAESFSTGVLDRQGLNYDTLTQTKRDLVMISLTMQGHTGPFSTHVGFGRTLAALAGFDHLTGWPDSNPAGPNQPYTDLVVPWFAVTAIISALQRRHQTGQGQHIDLSQLEASLHFLAPALLDYTTNGNVQDRVGNRVPGASPHGVFPCSGGDRWIAIVVNGDQDWQALCNAMDAPSLSDDSRFATLLSRKTNEDLLETILAEWTKPKEADDVVQCLSEAGVHAALVARGEDLHRDPQLAHRGHLKVMEHPITGYRTHSRPSFRFSNLELDHRRAPLFGEHEEEIYGNLLGIPMREVQRLRESGVIG